MMPAPLRETDFLKAFVLLAVCSVIGGAIAGGIMGGIIALVAHAVSASIDTVRIVVPVLSGLSGLIVTYFFFRLLVLRLIVRKIIISGTAVDPQAI
jgi:hypothetical protein